MYRFLTFAERVVKGMFACFLLAVVGFGLYSAFVLDPQETPHVALAKSKSIADQIIAEQKAIDDDITNKEFSAELKHVPTDPPDLINQRALAIEAVRRSVNLNPDLFDGDKLRINDVLYAQEREYDDMFVRYMDDQKSHPSEF